MNDRPIMLDKEMPVGGAPAAVQSLSRQSSTTLFERVLILMTMVTLPLSNQFPTVVGMSSSFLIFAICGAYVIVNRLRALNRVWLHPVFIAGYAFIGISSLVEFSSPLTTYGDILRFAHMLGGAVFLSALCRDRAGLTAALYGYISAALWVSLYLYLTAYGAIQGMGAAENFNEATKIRAQAFQDKELQANINTLGFICAQGAVVAFAFSVASKVMGRRVLFLGVTAFCLVASFLPMSRGTTVVALVTFAVVLYTCGFKHGKTLILVSILGVTIYGVVPDAVWSRMAFTTQPESGKLEGRARVYTRALNRLPEYFVSGVGSGNFWNKWGFEKGFGGCTEDRDCHVSGAHNAWIQVTINWGVLALLSYMMIAWCSYRTIPSQCGRDEPSLALIALVTALGLWSLESHGYYDKWFATGLGMLVGARLWIWPSGIVSAVGANKPGLYGQI